MVNPTAVMVIINMYPYYIIVTKHNDQFMYFFQSIIIFQYVIKYYIKTYNSN